MRQGLKDKIVAVGFFIILFVIFIANVVKKDEAISVSERRRLAQAPVFSMENFVKGNTMKDLDRYAVDQFVLRDTFKSVKYLWNDYVFKQKDNNGLFLNDGGIYKIEYPLNNENVEKSANKIKSVYENYLNDNMNIYYSIIPDKNYYLQSDYLKIDVNDIQKTMQELLPEMEYIDITNCLDLDDYYKTDLHWKQENLDGVVSVLEEKMGLESSSDINYEVANLGDFYGVYYGQLGRSNVEPDNINILIDDTIENCMVYNYETMRSGTIYDEEKMRTSADKYDVFLSGATPLITIENPNGPEGKELILFRDSFGSSIAPLLLESYKKITLVDLRYVSSSILSQYINFEEQDVLFLYSSLVLNQNILK